MRLFFAITFPETIKESLSHTAERLRAQLPSGNWTLRENYHLTLVFLGELTPMHAEKAREVLHTQGFPAFSLICSGLDRFHKGNRDIWWVGLEASEPLSGLYRSLFNDLMQAGFKLEDRPYRPHLTLARGVKPPKGPLPVHPFLDDNPCMTSGKSPAGPLHAAHFEDRGLLIPVTSISLMESVRVDGRLVYRECDRQGCAFDG